MLLDRSVLSFVVVMWCWGGVSVGVGQHGCYPQICFLDASYR